MDLKRAGNPARQPSRHNRVRWALLTAAVLTAASACTAFDPSPVDAGPNADAAADAIDASTSSDATVPPDAAPPKDGAAQADAALEAGTDPNPACVVTAAPGSQLAISYPTPVLAEELFDVSVKGFTTGTANIKLTFCQPIGTVGSAENTAAEMAKDHSPPLNSWLFRNNRLPAGTSQIQFRADQDAGGSGVFAVQLITVK